MSKQRVQVQLYQAGPGGMAGPAISDTGGFIYVTKASNPQKATLTDKDGASQANGFALTKGHATFYIDDANDTTVDVYIACPGGQFVTKAALAPGVHEIVVDVNQRHQAMVIPFAQADFTANTETDTGFDEPTNALMLANPAVRVTTIDATETIDVGTLSTDTGDANGFIAAASLGTAALVKGSLANGAVTLGALLFVQDSANAGDAAPEAHVSGGKSITITTSAGSDTGKGYIYLPYVLCN